jgi:hypothetical protein
VLGNLLRQVQDIFSALDAELSSHLMKEEQVLFPYIVAVEAHAREGSPKPQVGFGSARNPIGRMEHEHESAGQALAKLREVTHDCALPADARPTSIAMYEELQRMEADLHQHIHLENNVLFPRAIELERASGGKRWGHFPGDDLIPRRSVIQGDGLEPSCRKVATALVAKHLRRTAATATATVAEAAASTNEVSGFGQPFPVMSGRDSFRRGPARLQG